MALCGKKAGNDHENKTRNYPDYIRGEHQFKSIIAIIDKKGKAHAKPWHPLLLDFNAVHTVLDSIILYPQNTRTAKL